MTFQADIILNHDGNHRINAKRIALLEAVGRTGSIAAAARQVGLSYKAAWEGLEDMQKLISRPLLKKTTGGRGGGGTKLSCEGVQLLEMWHRLQLGLTQLVGQLQDDFGALNLHKSNLLQGFMMRTSARNVFSGQICEIRPSCEQKGDKAAVLANVCLDLGNQIFIHSSITHSSVTRLGLAPYRHVHALVKASFVHIYPLGMAPSTLLYNHLSGTICNFSTDNYFAEMTVDLGHAQTITATCSKHKVEQDGLSHGIKVSAQFSPADVILATY